MRNLRTSDIFAACRLLSAIGIREEIRDVAKQAEENKGKRIQFDMGFDLLMGILEKATAEHAENEIYKFISNLFECDWESVRDMDPIELFDKLEQVASIEKWKNFFKRVADLMKKK
jgi:hypothetical protein